MSTSRIAGAPRQAAILATIAGLHVGAALVVMAGLDPRPPWLTNVPPVIFAPPQPPPPKPVPVEPGRPEPLDYGLPGVPEPPVELPDFVDDRPTLAGSHAGPDPHSGAGARVPVPDVRAPTLRTRDRRLSALIDACYPASSRRLSEQGRVLVEVNVDAAGRLAAWKLVERSGFARIDAAVECVVRRLEFVPGRRDGEAVEAAALLPIVFRLD
jgi:protein TonB